ncbi:thioredoxin [Paractinoplanes hotanensis]|uniref:Thioredoxin n=1 Tax=Paractinoplanes hotanensis TaxID=2906497 RepID=A0ABT0XRD2_9ACTN|nr:thioredoxin [Actinoplanes hotanensis]MCM4076326.1 thioredoxin [Actinoplanes hotanensis]
MRTPSLADAEWLNSPPLGPDDLHGHVVLYDFWTLTCVNWLRTAPYRLAWWNAYRQDGLIVVGVHTPEFGFEHSPELVRRAVAGRGIDYPVVIDNDYAVWKAFDNHYWPALYLADGAGVIRDHHFGEGEYEGSERSIQRLLGISRPLSQVEPAGVEVEADWTHLRTPETYLGYARGEHFAAAGEAEFGRRHTYTYSNYLLFNHWALDGEWTVGSEHVTLSEPDGGIAFRFQARDANLVLDRAGGEPVPFRVTLDGEAPGDAAGLDISADGAGVLDQGRMYQLIRQPGAIGEKFLEITFTGPGARAYVFTFG